MPVEGMRRDLGEDEYALEPGQYGKKIVSGEWFMHLALGRAVCKSILSSNMRTVQ